MVSSNSNRKKIAIVGTGAMGSVYAGLLADAGHEVWAIDAWKEHVAAMTANGLTVDGASGHRTVRLNATINAADAGSCDLVIIATKAADVEAAARSVAPLLKADTPVLTIQNGLGSADKVAAIVGADRVLIGVVGGFGASIKAPGHAHHNGMEFLRLGEMKGGVSPRLEDVAETWRSGGFKVLTFGDIHKMIWEKLICNTTYSAPCALMGWTIGQMQANPHAWAVCAGAATEAFTVAKAKGVSLDFTDVVAYVKAFGEKIPDARPSMLLDHMAGRPSEIDVINGAIPREGRGAGVPTPVNDTLVALVKARESAFGKSA
jgi:2-dehydropantoate 2-reductase